MSFMSDRKLHSAPSPVNVIEQCIVNTLVFAGNR